MNQRDTAILVRFVFYLPTFALYHFMVFRVNKHLAQIAEFVIQLHFLAGAGWLRATGSFILKAFFTHSQGPLRSSSFSLPLEWLSSVFGNIAQGNNPLETILIGLPLNPTSDTALVYNM
jgi:hypothetical protein